MSDRRSLPRPGSLERRSNVRVEVIYRDDVLRSGALLQLFRIWCAGEAVLEVRRYPSDLVKGL